MFKKIQISSVSFGLPKRFYLTYSYFFFFMKRIIAFDYVRSICALWIIGLWHYHKYLSPEFHLSGDVFYLFSKITVIILGTFTFLSSFFLKKYEFFNTKDVIIFFKKRFYRFYILLFLSSIAFFFLGWYSPKQVIQIMTGTNCFGDNPAFTLWYFSMMIFFYLITPIIRWKNNRIRFFLTSFTMVVSVIFIHNLQENIIDKRFAQNLPLYLLGLVIPTQRLVQILSKLFVFSLFTFLTIFFMWIDNSQSLIIEILYSIFGTFSLISFCLISYRPCMFMVSIYLSTASMVAYLFHRQIYILTQMTLHHFFCIDYFPLLISPLLIAFIFIFSHSIQTHWDKICRKLFSTY